jgi:hypothetical protein
MLRNVRTSLLLSFAAMLMVSSPGCGLLLFCNLFPSLCCTFVPALCPDADGDGVPDIFDVCPGEDDTIDANEDGVPDCVVTAAKILSSEPADVVQADAVAAFSHNMVDGTGHTWDLRDRGTVGDGFNDDAGTSDAFDTFVRLFIDDTEFPAQATADLEDEREVVYGPAAMSGLDVTRKVFVSETHGFARWLDILENNSGADVTVAVRIEGNLGSDENNDFVISSTNGNTTLEAGDSWWVNCQHFGSDPCVAAFSCGATMSKSDDDLTHDYGMIDIPDGTRVIILTFVIMRSPDFSEDFFESLAEAIDEMIEQMQILESFPLVPEHFLGGISSAELNDILGCNGAVRVLGLPGAVAGGAEVTCNNVDSGDERTVTAGPDGSFETPIVGDSGDEITVEPPGANLIVP